MSLESNVSSDISKAEAEAKKLETVTIAEFNKLIGEVKSGKVTVPYYVLPLLSLGSWIVIEIVVKLLAHL